MNTKCETCEMSVMQLVTTRGVPTFNMTTMGEIYRGKTLGIATIGQRCASCEYRPAIKEKQPTESPTVEHIPKRKYYCSICGHEISGGKYSFTLWYYGEAQCEECEKGAHERWKAANNG